MREGSSIAATKASAVNCPTPGIVISRRQAAEALVMRLMSASIAATGHHGSPCRNQTPHGCRGTRDPFAGPESLVDEGGGERAREPDPEHDRQASDPFSKVTRWPTSFLRAMINERMACAESDFTCRA